MVRTDSSSTAPQRAKRRGLSRFVPTRVRLWHFLALPTLAMPLVIGAFELLEHGTGFPTDSEHYSVLRTAVISAAMAGIIGALAYNYRIGFIRELERRNHDLAATRDFLTGVIEGSGEGIITCDDQDRISGWNRAAEAIYGYGSDEMKGRAVTDLFVEGDPMADAWREQTRRLREGEPVRRLQAEKLHKDGRSISVAITRSPLADAAGRHIGSIAIVADVSELKEMERLLREQERLAAVGQLAATVAHEIKNPLAGIRGACEIIDRRFDPGDNEKELTKEVLHEVDRLNHTVAGLLDFTRPRRMQTIDGNIHDVLDSVVALATDDPRSKSVSVERDYGDLPSLTFDPHQMEQVFLNLLLNAFDALDYDGTVRISTTRNSHDAVIRVEDGGRGVDPANAEKIFEPFFTTRTHGWGLGLAIVRKIVQEHGGRIELDPPAGGGAAFNVYLPMEA